MIELIENRIAELNALLFRLEAEREKYNSEVGRRYIDQKITVIHEIIAINKGVLGEKPVMQ